MYTGGGSWSLSQLSSGHPNGLYSNGALISPNNFSSSQSHLSSVNGRGHQGISAAGVSSTIHTSMMHQPSNGLMPPPSTKSRISQLQDEKKKAAKQRWQEQQQREQAKKEQELFSTDLFNAPVRENDTSGSNVAKVLGTFSDAQNVITSKTPCIGIDYQPPTPAPSLHHIIGDDDDDRFTVPNAIHNSNDLDIPNIDSGHLIRNSQNHDQFRTQKRVLTSPYQSSQTFRVPDNHILRPSEKSFIRSSSSIPLGDFQPPSGFPRTVSDASFPPHLGLSQQSSSDKRFGQGFHYPMQASQNRLGLQESDISSQSRLKQASRALTKLPLQTLKHNDDDDKDKVQEMLLSIMHPVRTPLEGIVTPRVELSNHMGNTGRYGIPKYTSFTSSNSFIGSLDSPPRAPIKSEPEALIEPILSHRPEPSINSLGTIKGPCLSEDSDSDNHKSNKATSFLPSKPVTETTKPKSSSGDSSSNESSSYDSSSDEDEKISQKSRSSPVRDHSVDKDLSGSDDEKNIMGSDNDFSLQTLISKAKSTHSPHGPHSNLSQHQPSPKNPEAFPNTINSLSMSIDCLSDQHVKDDEDAMSNFLRQPLPELIEPISSPFSSRSSISLKKPRHVLSDNESITSHANKGRKSQRTLISPLLKSPPKKQPFRKISERISDNSDEEHFNQPSQKTANIRLTPSRTPTGRPLPRASATPALKSTSSSEEHEDEGFHPAKRQQKNRGKSSRPQNRINKKPTPKVTYSSSSSDDEVETELSPKHPNLNSPVWRNVQKRGGINRTRHNKLVSSDQNLKSEPDEDDEKCSEKDVSNKKTAISMIFAGAKAGKSTGKSGIKVEIQTQGPTFPSSSTNLSPPTVAIKSQGLSHAATLTSHSPVNRPIDNGVKRRPDGRPVLICCIPITMLGPGLSNILSRRRTEAIHRKRKLSEEILTDKLVPPLPNRRQQSKKSKLDGVVSSPQTSSSTDSANLMPPPNQVFYSYMENRRSEEEEYADIDVSEFTNMAKRMKLEGDLEAVSELQSIKYLRSVLYLSLAAIGNEIHGEKPAALHIYKESLDLLRKIPSVNTSGSIGSKLSVLSNRCQSLLYLRMYKLRRQELKECQKILGDHLLKASTQADANSPTGQQQTISPTPSPAGSEGSMCSKSSGYTSANELTNGGMGSTPSLTVPQNVMQKQHIFVNYLSQCHEIWDLADISAHRSHSEDFIIRLDRMFGPLTLHSSIKELVKYTQAGIDILLKEKETSG